MKVGLVTPYIYPLPGGVNQHVQELYENLVVRGHDVRIISSTHGPQKSSEGDIIRLDAPRGRLSVLVDAGEFNARAVATADLEGNEHGVGRGMSRTGHNQAGRKRVSRGDPAKSMGGSRAAAPMRWLFGRAERTRDSTRRGSLPPEKPAGLPLQAG